MLFSNKLLPYSFRKYAFGCISVGVLLLFLYFKDKRPAFLEVSTFAISSTYLENRYFAIIKTNLLDELGFLFSIIGIALLVLTKERNEEKIYDKLRFEALLFAIKLTLLLWIFFYFTLYGFVIFGVSNFIFVLFLLIYFFRFKYLTKK